MAKVEQFVQRFFGRSAEVPAQESTSAPLARKNREEYLADAEQFVAQIEARKAERLAELEEYMASDECKAMDAARDREVEEEERTGWHLVKDERGFDVVGKGASEPETNAEAGDDEPEPGI